MLLLSLSAETPCTPAECYVCSQEMSVSSAPEERHVIIYDKCGNVVNGTKNLFEKWICKVRTAHQPLKAPAGIKRVDNECDRNPTGT